MKKNHITKKGKVIPIVDLDINHLKNIIKLMEKTAGEGKWIMVTSVGSDPSDICVEKKFLKGVDYLNYFGYDAYINEIETRKNNENN